MKNIFPTLVAFATIAMGSSTPSSLGQPNAPAKPAQKKEIDYMAFVPNGHSTLMSCIYSIRCLDDDESVHENRENANLISGLTRPQLRALVFSLIKMNQRDCINDRYYEGDCVYSVLFLAILSKEEGIMNALIEAGCHTELCYVACPISEEHKEIVTKVLLKNEDPEVRALCKKFLALTQKAR